MDETNYQFLLAQQKIYELIAEILGEELIEEDE